MQTFSIASGPVTVQAKGKSGVSFNRLLLPNGVYTLSSDSKNVLLTLIGQLHNAEPIAHSRDGFVDTGLRRAPAPGECYFITTAPNCVYRAVAESKGGIPQAFSLPPASYGILEEILVETLPAGTKIFKSKQTK